MSDQVAQGADPYAGAAPSGQPGGVGAKPYDIQQCAHDAQTALEKLATELGKSDAPNDVIQAVSSYADDVAQIAKASAKLMDHAADDHRPTMDDAAAGLASDVRQQ